MVVLASKNIGYSYHHLMVAGYRGECEVSEMIAREREKEINK